MSARAVCACGWRGSSTSPARAEAAAAKHVCRTDDGVRRATRRFRCGRCFLEAVYENAGAAEARYWFSRHSCRKREEAMLRAALAEEKRALVDRTPKPCLHPVAGHQHGTAACYVLDLCRCDPCSDANRTRNEYRHGEGQLVRGPSRRVLRSTAEAIYAVQAIPANLGFRTADHERTPLARLHLRALVALGWSMSELGRRLGFNYVSNFCPIVTSDRIMGRATVDRVEALYAELSMTLPLEETPAAKVSAARARRYARDRGWVPPLAIDDDDPFGLELDQAVPG